MQQKQPTEVKPKSNSGQIVVNSTSQKQISTPVKKLTPKQTGMVTERIKDPKASKAEIIRRAGYNVKKSATATQVYNENMRKPEIQQAIDEALAIHELTAEHAIAELKTIVDQNEEIGAKRLAIKDVLELHGWRKNERPTVSLTVNQAFFGKSRVIKE